MISLVRAGAYGRGPMKRLICALALAAFLSPAARADDVSDVVRGSLLTGWRMEDGRHMAGIRLTLAPGWKTYWRAPGDAGIPPRFDWTGSGNVASATAHWPAPEVFWQSGLRSVGYSGEVVLPVEFRAERPDAPIRLSGRIDIGVCDEICIPVSLSLSGDLPAAGPAAGEGAIRAALADRPMTETEAGVGEVVCEVSPISDGLRLAATVQMPPIAPREDVVIEFSDPAVWVSEAKAERRGDIVTAVAELVPPEARPFAIARDGIRITVIGGGEAVDIRGCTGG